MLRKVEKTKMSLTSSTIMLPHSEVSMGRFVYPFGFAVALVIPGFRTMRVIPCLRIMRSTASVTGCQQSSMSTSKVWYRNTYSELMGESNG